VTLRSPDVVVLNTDLPAQGLKRGDLGAVVDVRSPDAIDVEFVTASGRTQALGVESVCDDSVLHRSRNESAAHLRT